MCFPYMYLHPSSVIARMYLGYLQTNVPIIKGSAPEVKLVPTKTAHRCWGVQRATAENIHFLHCERWSDLTVASSAPADLIDPSQCCFSATLAAGPVLHFFPPWKSYMQNIIFIKDGRGYIGRVIL